MDLIYACPGWRYGHHHPAGPLTFLLRLDKLHQVRHPQLEPDHLFHQLLNDNADFFRDFLFQLQC